jgi:hypothetical protein
MSKSQELRTWIANAALDIAKELEFSKCESASLLASLWRSFDDLERLRHEECNEETVLKSYPGLGAYADSLKIHVAAERQAIIRAYSIILGIHYGIVREAYRRMSRNKVNLNFGLLKLGHNLGDNNAVKKALGHLRAIFLSIPKKKDPEWFHPEGKEGWIGVIDVAIAEQLNRFVECDPISTLQRMLENGFRFMYDACQDRMIDEIRKLDRHPKLEKVGSIRDVTKAFSIPASPVKPEAEMQRRSLRSFIKELSRGGKGGGIPEILEVTARFLEETAEIRDATEKEIRTHFVERVSVAKGVSKEQAREDLRRFKVRLKEDEDLQRVMEEIRSLGDEAESLRIRVGTLSHVEAEKHSQD